MNPQVVAGRYEGDTGLIVRVEQNRVVLFSDLSMHELEVLPRDLQLCSDMATGVDSLGQFQWGDLVQLDTQTVGVIVRLERENFHVLSMHGKVVEARPQGLTKRRENRNAVALDSQQNTIQKKDIVKVVDGPHAGRGGEIKHLYRSFAFLHSRMFVDNGGIFVCKTRHLQLSGGNKANSINSMSPAAGFMSPRIASPMHPSGLVFLSSFVSSLDARFLFSKFLFFLQRWFWTWRWWRWKRQRSRRWWCETRQRINRHHHQDNRWTVQGKRRYRERRNGNHSACGVAFYLPDHFRRSLSYSKCRRSDEGWWFQQLQQNSGLWSRWTDADVRSGRIKNTYARFPDTYVRK